MWKFILLGIPRFFNNGTVIFLSLLIVPPNEVTLNGLMNILCEKCLYADSGFIIELEAPLSIKIFKLYSGMKMKGSLGCEIILFKSRLMHFPRLALENLQFRHCCICLVS